MKLYFVTSSESKISEVSAYFAAMGEPAAGQLQFCPVRHDVQEIMHPDLEVVVRFKALEAYKYLRQPCLVEHGGLFFEGLRDLPGPLGQDHLERGGGAHVRLPARRRLAQGDRARLPRLLRRAPDSPLSRRDGGRGRRRTARGDYNRHNWDPIFIPEGTGETYGEMGEERKAATSPMMRAWGEFLKAEVHPSDATSRRGS